MRQQLYDYLSRHPGGATSPELLQLLFSSGFSPAFPTGRSAEFGSRLLHAALGADPNFSYDARTDRWSIVVHRTLQQLALHAPFTVLDLETTGLKPGAAGITEIAAIRVEHGAITKEFHSLVNPGRRVPAMITRLTGITDEMLRDQPTINTVFPRLQTFLGSTVLVAHNVDFDLSFLNFEARRFTSATLFNPSLCTLRLAKRLLPSLRSRSLDAVASHLGVRGSDRHRALGDARLTAEVLFLFLEKIKTLGIESLGELLDFQHNARDGRRFEFFVPRPFLTTLPEAPGVYHMFDSERRLLYIGKAKNLRRRVSSYFTNSYGHSDKVLDLIRNVREVTYEEAGSELEAALREAALIRELKPPYNTLSKHLPRVAFLKLTITNPYPRLAITAKPASDRAFYIGPFRSREFTEKAQRLLARLFGLRTCHGNLSPMLTFTPCLSGQIGACSAPCNSSITHGAYAAQVKAFLQFLQGEDASLRTALVEKRDQLAADLKFEGAARLQQDIQLLDQIAHVHDRLHGIVTQGHAFLLLPSRKPGAAQAYLVLNGRLIYEALAWSPTDLMKFAILARENFSLHRDLPLRPEEIDSSVIIAAWLRDPARSQGAVFPIENPSTLFERLDEITTSLQDLQRIESIA